MLYQFTLICFNKINLYGRGVFYIILRNYAFATRTAAAKTDRHSETVTTASRRKLICTRCGNRTKWYRSDGHTKTYIPKDQKPYASQLAIRRYLLEKQKEYQKNLDALAYYFRHSYNSGKAEQLLTYDSAYHSLLAEHFQPVSQELQTWESSPYNKNKKLSGTIKT